MKQRMMRWLWAAVLIAGAVFLFSRVLDMLYPDWYRFGSPVPRVMFNPGDAVPMGYWFWTGILPVFTVLSGLLLVERLKKK